MGRIIDQFANAFRDFAIEGIPTSGLRDVVKSEVRAIGPLIESSLGAVGMGTLVSAVYPTKAALDADLAHAADAVGLVYADGTDDNNDLYVKVGASGAGSWTRTEVLHSFVSALDTRVAALEDAGLFRPGTLAEREDYTYRHGGTPDVKRGMHWYATDQGRFYVWLLSGDKDPKSDVTLTSDGWVSIYTVREFKNLGIDFFGLLPQANIADLEATFSTYDSSTYAARISDFRARALTSGSTITALLDWSAGGALTGFTLSWGGFGMALGADARSFDTTPTNWPAQKRLIATGDSMLDDKWVEAAAATLGYTLANVSKYSSGSKQVYRLGVRQLRFTVTGNSIPASGTGVQVTSINGVTPSTGVSFDGFAAAGFLNTYSGDTISTHCSEAGTLGGRHGVVSVPNAGTPTYTFTPDDGATTASALDPQSLFIPDNLARLKTDEVLIRSTQNTFFAGPDNPAFPNNINPIVLEDIGLIVNATGGQRVTILSLTPASDFAPGSPQRVALTYFNDQLAVLWPQQRAYIPGVGTNYDYIRANGSDGSANDVADIANGLLPRSCVEDGLHLNAKGQALERAFFLLWRAVQKAPPSVTDSTVFTLEAAASNPRTAAVTSATVATSVTSDASAVIASTIGLMVSGQWRPITGLPRLRLIGTGTVKFDADNGLGTITTEVASLAATGATNQIEYPYLGDDTTRVRPMITGSLSVELL